MADEQVTTLMFRNVPAKYTALAFLAEILEQVHKSTIDFVHLPVSTRTKDNLGFAFINFVNAEIASRVLRTMNKKQWTLFKTPMPMEILPAFIQGFRENLAHCASKLDTVAKEADLPLIFRSGEQIPFHAAIQMYLGEPSGVPFTAVAQNRVGRSVMDRLSGPHHATPVAAASPVPSTPTVPGAGTAAWSSAPLSSSLGLAGGIAAHGLAARTVCGSPLRAGMAPPPLHEAPSAAHLAGSHILANAMAVSHCTAASPSSSPLPLRESDIAPATAAVAAGAAVAADLWINVEPSEAFGACREQPQSAYIEQLDHGYGVAGHGAQPGACASRAANIAPTQYPVRVAGPSPKSVPMPIELLVAATGPAVEFAANAALAANAARADVRTTSNEELQTGSVTSGGVRDMLLTLMEKYSVPVATPTWQ